MACIFDRLQRFFHIDSSISANALRLGGKLPIHGRTRERRLEFARRWHASARSSASWLKSRHEMALAVADQVGAAHAVQRFTQQRPVLGVVIAQKRLVQAALASAADDFDRL